MTKNVNYINTTDTRDLVEKADYDITETEKKMIMVTSILILKNLLTSENFAGRLLIL